MILDPHRSIAMALHVMLGTVIRTISWFVLVDHTRISLLPQVRNKSEHSLKEDAQVKKKDNLLKHKLCSTLKKLYSLQRLPNSFPESGNLKIINI